MERFNALGRGMQVMLVGGVLLLITTFFNWQEIEFDLGPLGEGSAGQSAWNGFWGVVMGLLTIVLLAWIVARLAAVEIPIPVSSAMTAAILAFLILAFAVIKNLVDDYSTFWSYLGIVFAAAIAVGAWLQVQESGGVESLRSELPGMSTTSEPAAATTPPPPPPAAPSEPAPHVEAPPETMPPPEAPPEAEPGMDPDRER
jgi:hypothetical protein